MNTTRRFARLLLLTVLLHLTLVTGLAAQRRAPADPSVTITRDYLEGWVTRLSADELRGRRAFTPDIDRAADLLAAEMKAIGLRPFQSGGFRQAFSVYEVRPRTTGLVLNGLLMRAEDLFAVSGYERIEWDLKQQTLPVERIQAGEMFAQRYSQVRQSNRNALVLVHPSHADAFRRIRARVAQGQRLLDRNAGATRVFVLTPDTFLLDYKLQLENNITELPAANVVGMIPGRRRDQLVVISAHYDHIGILKAVDGDSIANGADDDASGTAAVLALARHYATQRQKPERTLVFACFTAEEVGMYGSQLFARTVKPEQVVAMCNLEMLGKPSKWGAGRGFLTGYERSSLGELIQDAAPGTFQPDPYPTLNLFFRSDNATLARLGVPAHTFSSDQIDQDKYYHTVDDEAITLDFDHLTQVTRAIARAIAPIVAGSVAPTRVSLKPGE